MRFSENRLIARIVLALAIAASLVFGGGGALRDLRTDVETCFYANSESISAELLEMRSNAATLLSIAHKYDTAGKEYIDGMDKAIGALDAAEDISGKFQASLTLDSAVENLYSHLTGLKLGEVDTQDIRYAYKNFTSAQLRISHDPYNERAAEFNKELNRFPAGLLGALAGVKPLALFQ